MIFDRFLASAEIEAVLDDRAFVQAMLDFEAALALSQSELGVIPPSAGLAIARACRVDRLELEALVVAGRLAGTLAVPLSKQLTAAVAQDDAEASLYVHWGATSQDVLDTAQVLVARRALALFDADLGLLVDALIERARSHLELPMLARTLLQPAQVTSFGFKALAWIEPLQRARERLREVGQAALQLQLAGPVGTLASMGEAGEAVRRRVAERLQLRDPQGPWHTERDEWVNLGCALGLLAGSLGKLATDLALLSQGEVGEVLEPSGKGRGSSSSMPHKRNPVAAMVGISAAVRAPQQVAALLAAMPQAHERALGPWQAELAVFPTLLATVHGALAALGAAAPGLQIDGARMREHIDALRGLIFAEALSMRLAREIGKTEAHHRVEQWSGEAVARKIPLGELSAQAIAADPKLKGKLSPEEVASLFDPAAPAAHAARLAAPRLDALEQASAALRQRPPWQAWLPESKTP